MAKFIIYGRFIPYVRMTQRSKFVNPRARAYLDSQNRLGWEYRQQMDGKEPFGRVPLMIKIEITMTGGLHRSDLSNQTKALEDSAQGIVFDNDCWVDRIEVSRRLGDKDVVEIEIKELLL